MQKRAYREKCGAENKRKQSRLLPGSASFILLDCKKKKKRKGKKQRFNNGRGHIREAGAAPVQHQRAQNKAGTVRTELTQAYIILRCENLSHS